MTATTANTNPPAPVSAPPSARILLVEDSEHDRRFFSRLLEKSEEPYEVVYSHDGEAALELLKHQKFDLLISDLNMPGMDGIELIRQAQPYLGDSGALILTGSRDVHSAAEAVRLRIMDYILKEPRDALRENLLPQIAGALKQIRLMRENKRLERELRLRLAHLEQIHQQMPEALFATLDNAHKVIEINEQARDLLGLGPDAPLAGRKITELLASLSEGLADSVDDLCAKQQEARNLYIEAVSPDKPPRLFTLSLKLLDPKMMAGNGDLPSSILSLRDITPAESGRPAKEEAIFHGIVGRDPAILEICHLVRQVAPLPTSVLITGPTGSGKEVVARAIHEESDRAKRPYIAVNCTALSSEILESELFGHVRGAFTGAVNARKGRFREADGGTLFLDEIGDTSESFQSKLLRALDSGQIEPVGQDRPVQVDVRILCATNKDLEKLVREGKFREDLFFRINVVHIRIPPLAERIGDLPLLVERFRHEFNTRFKKSVRFVSQEVMRAMAQYHWPGNIRELRHVMERAFVVAQGPILSLADLPPQIAGRQPAAQSGLEPAIPPQSHAVQPGGLPSNGHAAAGAGDEVAQIRAVLAENGGNIGRAATQLKMHRTTLWRKMRQYGIEA